MNLQDTIINLCETFRLMMEKILTRDYRTTFHRVSDSAAKSHHAPSTLSILSLQRTKYRDGAVASHSDVDTTTVKTERNDHAQRHLPCDSHLVPAFYDDRGIRRRYRTSNISRRSLSCILVILLLSLVHSSPIMSFQGRRLSSTPKWVNPCGLVAENFDDDLDVVQLKDDQLLQQVVIQAKTALMHAQLFRDDFIRHTFKTDFEDLQITWGGQRYNWLPGPEEIPKKLGEKLSEEYLENLELDATLTDAYEYMQKYAVGLEQIVWDQEDYHLEFRKKFKETEFKLRTVLCELQIALVERGVTRRQDITRDIMSSEFRTMPSATAHRELRDWLIFRDYMNGLEYVVQVFEHLLKRARQERDPMEA